ncbi:shikimate kinase [Allomuricauda sp. d1]|uniref:shikimate kinase n=1 Tax=Allomuricauda sp. d1 TaxID=3136725 RepID=UPI0031DF6371
MNKFGFLKSHIIKPIKIVLVGYMASGKSSLGTELAETLNIDFVDLDQTIEASEKMSISELFATKGEIYFRKKEGIVLDEVFQRESFVLSTGGGTPCYGKNMEKILLNSTHSFYLRLSIQNLVERIKREKADRPLVRDIPDEELEEFIRKHLFERSFFYTQAKKTIDCNNKSVAAIVADIQKMLV